MSSLSQPSSSPSSRPQPGVRHPVTGHPSADPASPPRRRRSRLTALGTGGPTAVELVRAVPAIRRDPLGYLECAVAEHGDLVAFPMPGAPVLLVNDPAAARQVLQDNHRAYGKQTLQYTALSAVAGNGLLTSDGEAWRARRRLVQPAFHRAGLDRVAAESVAAASRLHQAWSAAGDQPVAADHTLQAAMLEVLGHTLFDADLAPAGERVVHAVEEALRAVMVRAQSPLPGRLPTPSRRRLRRATAVLDEVCAGLVAGRRAAGVGADDADLLALLLRSVGTEGGLSDADVRDELVTLVIAGHETVAACLTWTLHLLAGHPQAQAAVHAELDEVLGGRVPGWPDLPRLPWLRACVDEALRLYPPAWVLTRRALVADELDGIDVPAGTLVIISPWLLHRRERSWPRPTRFDPQRFVGEQPEAVRAGAYLPFGAGPRLCIGREFALVEAVLVLATLLRDLRVDHPAGLAPGRVDALVTLRPRGGLPLLVTAR